MLALSKQDIVDIDLEVYGDPLMHPQDESYWGNVNHICVRTCYDEGKRVAETLMFDYHRQHGIEICIARIFNTYGPRMNIDDGRLISNFIAQAICNEPLTVQSPGTQTRSFCYVSDMLINYIGSIAATLPDVTTP
ncbi:UDP-glucuronic acid decarboxylase 6-like protein isoform X2 [Tanacetum coccineum]